MGINIFWYKFWSVVLGVYLTISHIWPLEGLVPNNWQGIGGTNDDLLTEFS